MSRVIDDVSYRDFDEPVTDEKIAIIKKSVNEACE